MAIETALKCPQCGELDAVRKVSAIYSSGFSTIPNNSPLVPYGVVDRTITTITPLAQKLVPPAPPPTVINQPNIKKPIETTNSILLRQIIFNILFFLVGIGLIFVGGIWMIFGIYFAVAIPINAFSLIRNFRNGKTKQVFNANLEKYNDIMSKHELAKFEYEEFVKSRWDTAYYCGRCDGVFIPGENEFAPINQFRKFIHKYK